MILLLVAFAWLASLAIFVGLRARATKSRLDKRVVERLPHPLEAPRSAKGRGVVSLGSSR
jgi:hypothetical protein